VRLGDADDEDASCCLGQHNHTTVPVLALVALSNLLVVAYPIMPRHSNKILCELLACLGRERKNAKAGDDRASDSAIQRRTLLLHVSAMAVVICGDPAVAFMDRLLQSPYDQCLHDCIREVKDEVVKTMNRSCAKNPSRPGVV
jgi:hypothetical protein